MIHVLFFHYSLLLARHGRANLAPCAAFSKSLLSVDGHPTARKREGSKAIASVVARAGQSEHVAPMGRNTAYTRCLFLGAPKALDGDDRQSRRFMLQHRQSPVVKREGS